MSSTAQELARLAETIRPETKAFIDGRFVDSRANQFAVCHWGEHQSRIQRALQLGDVVGIDGFARDV